MFSLNIGVCLMVMVSLVSLVAWDLSSGHQTVSGRCVWTGWCVWLAGLLGTLISILYLTVNILALRVSLQTNSGNYRLLYPWLLAYGALNSAIIPSGTQRNEVIFMQFTFSHLPIIQIFLRGQQTSFPLRILNYLPPPGHCHLQSMDYCHQFLLCSLFEKISSTPSSRNRIRIKLLDIYWKCFEFRVLLKAFINISGKINSFPGIWMI